MSTRSVTLSVLLCFLCMETSDGGISTLRLVNLSFRHGDRSSVVTFPNNNITWSDGLGWLTKEGMQMEYSLGRFIRRRYNGFLSSEYNHTELKVESSDLDRCLMSAYCNLAGLYSPSVDQEFNTNITWQPIPVHTRPTHEDNMLAIDKPCPRYDQLYDASLKTDRIRQEEKDNKAFYDFIKAQTGVKTESINDIWRIADTLFCEKQHNRPLPSWANDTVCEKLEELWTMNFGLLYYGKEESRLKGGPLLKEWIWAAQQKIDVSEYKIKMNMYSAHDTTEVALMNALQVYNNMLLPYTSAVIMELHKSTPGDYYVELYMRNHSSVDPNDDTQPYSLTIPGCDFQCPFDKFISLTKNAIPDDWDAECSIAQTTVQTPKTERDYKTAFIVTVAVYSVVALVLIVVVMVTCSKYRRGTKASGVL